MEKSLISGKINWTNKLMCFRKNIKSLKAPGLNQYLPIPVMPQFDKHLKLAYTKYDNDQP